MGLGLTREDRINTVFGGGGHVVILGAGASIAATLRNPLGNGKRLPAMNDFIKIVGLQDIVRKLPKNLRARNFETLYSNLYQDDSGSAVLKEVERRVYDYFKDMTLPEEATIYDYLILSLRSRDIIATFNWDPFLYQAFARNGDFGERPYIAFLHGSVALGYSKADERAGPVGWYSKETKARFEATKLLYPITRKNYTDDEFIKFQWDMLNGFLSDKAVKRLTIFGYGAPSSDVEAVQLMNKAWGSGQDRPDEQIEIIDIRPEDKVMKQWKNFIYSGHTDYHRDYFNSSLATNPRRTFESYFQHNFPMTPAEAFSESNPVPTDFLKLSDLQNWHKPLIEAEIRELSK
jgi:hypothetical protein